MLEYFHRYHTIFLRLRTCVMGGALVLFFGPTLLADDPSASGEPQAGQIKPMEVAGLDPRVARILRDHYEKAWGGESNWSEVESLRVEGTLRTTRGELEFIAYKKKPDYCKIELYGSGGARFVMAYDGKDAWQWASTESRGPESMPEKEALNFIRDASFSGHLFYPRMPGKTIELLGSRKVKDDLCYELRVGLPNGQELIYALDVSGMEERQQILRNAVSGQSEVVTYKDIRKISGVSVPFRSTMTIEGEFVQEIRIRQAAVNRGLMPWMFSRPTEAFNKEPEDSAQPEVDLRDDSARGPSLFDGGTAFSEPDTDEGRTILETIGRFQY